jgi:hypothetical protein
MKLKHLFIINAILALAYAFGELLIPKTMFSFYFVTETPTAEAHRRPNKPSLKHCLLPV